MTVTLEFQSIEDFLEFRKSLQTGLVDDNIGELHLTCELTQDEIEEAIKNYNAKVVKY